MDIINTVATVLLVVFAVSAGTIIKPALGTSIPVQPPVGSTSPTKGGSSLPGVGSISTATSIATSSSTALNQGSTTATSTSTGSAQSVGDNSIPGAKPQGGSSASSTSTATAASQNGGSTSSSSSNANSNSYYQPGHGNSIPAGCPSASVDQPRVANYPVCGTRQLKPLYQWPVLTYATPPGFKADSSYDPTDAYITGIVAFGSNLYLSTPSTNSILPSTLNTVPKTASSSSSPPALQPYPDMSWNEYDRDSPDCDSSLVAVHRTTKDNCNRLWVLDSGQLYTSEFDYENICPPKIVIFDLITNKMVKLITIPSRVLEPSSRLLNIILDNVTMSSNTPSTGTPGATDNSRNSQCDVKFVYMADTSDSALVVYNVENDSFNRISHPYMNPDPNVPYFTADGINFTSFYGILGMDVAGSGNNRYLYFSAFSSNNTYKIPTSALQQTPNYKDRSEIPVTRAFRRLGPGIAFLTDQSTGCLLYNPIDDGTVVGWNPAVQAQNVLATNRSILSLGLDMAQDFGNYQITYLAQSRIPQYRKKNRSDVTNVSILMIIRTG